MEHTTLSVHIRHLIDGLQQNQLTSGASPLDTRHRQQLEAIIQELRIAEAELSQRSEGIAVLKRALEIERQHYQTLIEYATDGYLVTEATGRILSSNQAAQKLLRRSKSQLVGRNITEFIAYDEVPDLRERLAMLTETDAFINWETQCQPSIGSPFKVVVSVFGVRDFVSHAFTLQWQIREVDQKRQSDRDEHEQQILLDALYDTLTVLNETVSAEDVLNQTLESIQRIAPLDLGCILLSEDHHLRLVRSFGYPDVDSLDAAFADLCLPDQKTSVEEYLIRSREPLLITDESVLSRLPLLPNSRQVGSMLAIPLVHPGGVIGAIVLCSAAPDFFTENRVERYQLFSVQTTVAFQYAQWYQSARYLAVAEERERVALALHDTVNQRLFSMSIISDVLPELWDTKPTKALAMLNQVRELTQDALEEMRTFLRDLRESSSE